MSALAPVQDVDIVAAMKTMQSADLRREIAHALAELMDEAPAARELLRARTFARTLH